MKPIKPIVEIEYNALVGSIRDSKQFELLNPTPVNRGTVHA